MLDNEQTIFNEWGQPIGFPVLNWVPIARPPRQPVSGRYCRLEPISVERHAAQLVAANRTALDDRNWTYLPYGPFNDLESYSAWLTRACLGDDPLFHAIIDTRTEQAVGVASYLRIDPNNGTIEVGGINFSPLLQRTPAATESMYLMMKRAFELGYRRYEWKCDALNAKSRAAALRLGLSYEGIFRQAIVYKGRNRDTAWYAAVDKEWPMLDAAFQKWLDPTNFDEQGQQRVSLSTLTAPILKRRD